MEPPCTRTVRLSDTGAIGGRLCLCTGLMCFLNVSGQPWLETRAPLDGQWSDPTGLLLMFFTGESTIFVGLIASEVPTHSQKWQSLRWILDPAWAKLWRYFFFEGAAVNISTRTVKLLGSPSPGLCLCTSSSSGLSFCFSLQELLKNHQCPLARQLLNFLWHPWARSCIARSIKDVHDKETKRNRGVQNEARMLH